MKKAVNPEQKRNWCDREPLRCLSGGKSLSRAWMSKIPLLYGLFGLVAAGMAQPLWAATITVCPAGCQHADVQEAIDAAVAGDTIQVGQGTYPANLHIAKNLTLQGLGVNQTTLNGRIIDASVVKIYPDSTVELKDLTLRGGLAETGAGIYNEGHLKVTNCLITDNKGAWTGAGVSNRADITIQGSTVSNNIGGAIDNSGGLLKISNSSIVNNEVAVGLFGCGICNDGFTIITQSTVSGNGHFQIFNAKGNLLIQNATIVGDLGHAAIGAWEGNIRLGNNIIVTPSGIPNCSLHRNNVGLSVTSIGGNITGDSECGLNDATDRANVADMKLGPLQINSPGSTPTHALLPGSPAIDTLVGASGAHTCSGSFLFDDQRGVSRPQGSGCDSGAYELRVPVAAADAYVTAQNQAFVAPTRNLLANDSSPEGLPMDVGTITAPEHGSLTYDLYGTLVYTPDPGFMGQDHFTYTAYDTAHYSVPATVTINVQPANHPPIGKDDSYTVFAGQALHVANVNSGVLANDSDPDGNPLRVVIVDLPTHGFVAMNEDGSFGYKPDSGFTGLDHFTYQATDGQALSEVTTVTIAVNPSVATITIVEDTQPNSPTDFEFTGDLGDFMLDDPAVDDGDVYGVSKTFDVVPGTYIIRQTKRDGWLTANISCSPVDNSIADIGQNQIQLTIAAGENRTCTFVNQRPGRMVARAYFDKNSNHQRDAGEPWLSGQTMSLSTNPIELPVLRVTKGDGKAVFDTLQPNLYTVCETPSSRWRVTTPEVANPVYGSFCHSVNVAPGQTATVVFGNNRVQ